MPHGAPSCPQGRVELRLEVKDQYLHLNWGELDGPRVLPPSRKGFGSRLLQEVLAKDLNGPSRLEFPLDGVCCWITARCEVGPSQ